MPEVSVVIPTRDRAELIPLGLRSVLAQSDVDLEVIVVDDGSRDGTPEVVEGLGDARVRLVRHPEPLGVARARNAGVAEARGEWVAFLDDDDLWAPDKLVHQLTALRSSGLEWAYTGDVLVDADLRITVAQPPPSPDELCTSIGRLNPVPSGSSNVIVRRALLAIVGPLDSALRRTEDWDLWIRLAREGPPAWVPAPLVACRVHGGNRPADVESMVREADVLAARYDIPVDRTAMLRRAAWTCMRAGRRLTAARYYVRAVRAGDRRSLARAVLALTSPKVGTDRVWELLPDRVEAGWAAEAELWLREIGTDRAGGVAR